MYYDTDARSVFHGDNVTICSEKYAPASSGETLLLMPNYACTADKACVGGPQTTNYDGIMTKIACAEQCH
jgi:hypothetical protein